MLFPFLMAACLVFAGSAVAAEFYVSKSGNDSWSGTLPAPNADKSNGPFATLERARDEIRRVRPRAGTTPVFVWVRSGIYSFARTFTLGPEDSGTQDAPVSFRAYAHEKPVLTGNKRISGFKPYKGQVLQADVESQGLGSIYFRQLFFHGKRQQLARYPNFDPKDPFYGGWAYVNGDLRNPSVPLPGDSKRTLRIKPQDLRAWAHPGDGEVFIFPRYNWFNNILSIVSVDPSKRTLVLGSDATYEIRAGDRYYVRNLFEELDAPGEWFLDQRTRTLYFWPPAPSQNPKKVTAYAPALFNIIEINKASNIVLRGFVIEGAEGDAIVVRDSTNCLIAGNIIRNVGGSADSRLSAVDVQGGGNNGVVGNDIYEVGGSAVALSGGDRKTLAPGGNYADNNHIHHTGILYKQGVGISLDGVGNRASHNLIHDTPRFGIMIRGNDHVIELNHIHHVDLETSDNGAIYTIGRDWLTPRGTVIRYNYIHDSVGYGYDPVQGKWVSPYFSRGIYLDDNAAGVDIYGNIVARAMYSLIILHNARDNRVENNIFIDGQLQQVELIGWERGSDFIRELLPAMKKNYEEYSRLLAWKKYRGFPGNPPKKAVPMADNQFFHNIFFYQGPDSKLYDYSNLPYGDFISDRNLIYHFDRPVLFTSPPGSPRQWEAWQKLGFDLHSVIADPLFVDAASGDYRLSPGSPAYKLGFQPIPIEKIGPYQDALRATWPIAE
jgi:hypothetical protein